VSDKLRFWNLCLRWVLKMLMDEYKMKREASALTLPTRYSEQDDFLSRIFTGDETWVWHVTSESKQQSMECRHTSLPIKKKIHTDRFN
jgi:hypothetical protein